MERKTLPFLFVLGVIFLLLVLPSSAIQPQWVYKTGKMEKIQGLAISPSGSYVAAVDGTLYIIDQKAEVRSKQHIGTSVSVSADGLYLAVGSETGICVYSSMGVRDWCYQDILGGVSAVTIAKDGFSAYAASGEGGRVYRFDGQGNVLWSHFTESNNIYCISSPLNGEYVAVGMEGGKMTILDSYGERLTFKEGYKGTYMSALDVVTSDDGGRILVAGDKGSQGIVNFMTDGGRVIWSYKTDGLARTAALSSEASRIVVGDWNISGDRGGTIYYLNGTGTGFESGVMLVWKYHVDGYIEDIAISADNAYVAAGSRNGQVYYMDKYGTLLWRYDTGSPVTHVAMTTDGSIVAAGTLEGTIYFFNQTQTSPVYLPTTVRTPTRPTATPTLPLKVITTTAPSPPAPSGPWVQIALLVALGGTAIVLIMLFKDTKR